MPLPSHHLLWEELQLIQTPHCWSQRWRTHVATSPRHSISAKCLCDQGLQPTTTDGTAVDLCPLAHRMLTCLELQSQVLPSWELTDLIQKTQSKKATLRKTARFKYRQCHKGPFNEHFENTWLSVSAFLLHLLLTKLAASATQSPLPLLSH